MPCVQIAAHTQGDIPSWLSSLWWPKLAISYVRKTKKKHTNFLRHTPHSSHCKNYTHTHTHTAHDLEIVTLLKANPF
jgi:hypothetical protein